MRTNARIYGLMCVCSMLLYGSINAQTYTEISGQMTVFAGSGASELSQRLYIAPTANINVIGEWRIASEEIFIAPGAVISGTGNIVFDKPTSYTIGGVPLAWGRQKLDGGNVPINCKVTMRNPDMVELVNLTPPIVFGYPTDNDANLRINNELTFADMDINNAPITSNHLMLNAESVVFGNTAVVTNYNPKHFVVTNGTGTIVKYALGTAGFVFPIGITMSDYCPAEIKNNGTPDIYRVRVLSGIYPGYDPERSVDRTWEISEEVAGGSDVTLTLQHNHVNGYGGQGSEGVAYNDSAAYIASSPAGTASWDTYASAIGTMPGTLAIGPLVDNASMLTRSGLNDFTYRTRYTKYSEVMIGPGGLQAVKTVNPDSIYIGDDFKYSFAITNTSSVDKPGPITLMDTLPAGAQYLGSAGDGWTVTESNGIIIAIYADTLHAGEVTIFEITVKSLNDDLKNVGYVYTNTDNAPTAPCDTCTPGDPTYPGIKYHDMMIPNAISPNGDGVNDKFRIPELSRLYPKASLAIYNRWSDGVWYSNGPYMNDFDGRSYSGMVLPDGTYFYVLDYNDGSGRKANGYINISR